VVKEVTKDELVDIYYNRPTELPQDDNSLNTIRRLIAGYKPTEPNQKGGVTKGEIKKGEVTTGGALK
jgi:hypothetical protein